MDYLKIVLDGYCNPTDKKFLKEYFIRESKKAEVEFYSPEVFLTGCKTAVQTYLIGDLHRQKQESERELFDAKQWAKENEPDTVNQRFEQEDNLNIEDYSVNLWQVTNGRYTCHIDYSEIMHISDTLDLLISVDALIDAVKNIPSIIGTDYGTLQFDETALQKIYVNFKDADIWEPIAMNDFIDNFREVPVLSLKIKDKPLFSYTLHHFKKSFINVVDKNKWMMEHFDIANFSKHKTLDYSNNDKATQLQDINVLLDKMGVRKNG